MSVWWCCNGVIHYNFLQPGQTITAVSYCRDLDLMHQKLQTFWTAGVDRKGPILLQDNARPHTSKTTWQKLTQLNIEVLPHTAYSPDLSYTEYRLFRALDALLRQKVFTNTDEAQNAFRQFVDLRDKDFCCKGISSLPQHCRTFY